jgi:LysR family transcriptional activator of nhaA
MLGVNTSTGLIRRLNVEVLGEFDDAALMKSFGAAHNAIFVALTLYAKDYFADENIVEIA